MAHNDFPHDRFDDVARDQSRIGAHRAENPRMRTGLVLLWAAVAAIALFIAGVFATLVITDRITFGGKDDTPSTSEPSPSATVDTSYAVVVLNATTDQSLTTTYTDKIIAAGWPAGSVDSLQAEETDFEHSVVYYSAEADLAAAEGLARALGVTAVEQSDVYAPADETVKQLVVVIGQSAAAP